MEKHANGVTDTQSVYIGKAAHQLYVVTVTALLSWAQQNMPIMNIYKSADKQYGHVKKNIMRKSWVFSCTSFNIMPSLNHALVQLQ